MADLTGMHGPAWRIRARRGAVALAAGALSAVLMLSGCAPGGDTPTAPSVTVLTEAELSASPTPTPSYDPEHLTDEQAVEIAVDVFNQYFAAYNQVLVNGTDSDSALEYLSTGPILEDYQSVVDRAAANAYQIDGTVLISNPELVSYDVSGGVAEITIGACYSSEHLSIYENGELISGKEGAVRVRTVALTVVHETDHFQAKDVKQWDSKQLC